MDFTILVYGLLPIVVFALADMMGNPRWGFALATMLACAETYWMYHRFETIDPVSVVGLVTIIGLGVMTLKTENRIYYKLQPILVALACALFLIYTQFVGPSIMQRYGEGLRIALPPMQAAQLAEPAFQAYMDRLFSGMIVVFFLYGVWMTWAAYKLSTGKWLLVRAFGVWVLAIPMVFIMARISGP